MSKERRVNFHELLQQEVIEGGEEIGHDNDFDVAEDSKHKLNIFWYGVKRGVTMLENQRSSLDDVKISEDEIDKDVVSSKTQIALTTVPSNLFAVLVTTAVANPSSGIFQVCLGEYFGIDGNLLSCCHTS